MRLLGSRCRLEQYCSVMAHLVLLLFQSCSVPAATACWQVVSLLHSSTTRQGQPSAARRRRTANGLVYTDDTTSVFVRGTCHTMRSHIQQRHGPCLTRTALAAAAEETPPSRQKPLLGRQQGVYVRPSAAIERGSGFFIPGLEGPKVRLLFGSLLLGLTIVNHGLSSQQNQNALAESLAALYSLLVLFQGAVEFFKTQNSASKGLVDNPAGATMTTMASTAGLSLLQQEWLVRMLDAKWRNRVEWVASTYVVLTPATSMLLVSRQQVVFSLDASTSASNPAIPTSDTTIPSMQAQQQATGCTAALETLSRSNSGRVALPMQHPAVTSLGLDTLGAQSKANRCVVLQRVNDELCWIMTSDQLLVSFTQQDLQWLGQLARYIDPSNFTDAKQ
jgi:hypothetical protein